MSNIINRDTIGDMARRAATKYGDKTAVWNAGIEELMRCNQARAA